MGSSIAKMGLQGLIPRDAFAFRKKVWLTFDDGPHPQNTEMILTVLERHQIKATFFVIGENVERFPDVMRLIHEAGHRIGNHTHSHPRLSKLPVDAIKAEIEKTDRLIAPYQGAGGKIFRPPFGDRNRSVDSIVRDLGYRRVMWNVDTKDWRSENHPDGWIEYGIGRMRFRHRCVILNHDLETTAQSLDEFIRRVKALGKVSFQSPWTL